MKKKQLIWNCIDLLCSDDEESRILGYTLLNNELDLDSKGYFKNGKYYRSSRLGILTVKDRLFGRDQKEIDHNLKSFKWDGKLHLFSILKTCRKKNNE